MTDFTICEFTIDYVEQAHGIKQMDDKQTEAVWSRLVQAAMERADREGSFYHSVTLFRHENLLREILNMYGFGNRFADSMLEVKSYQMAKIEGAKDVKIRKTSKNELIGFIDTTDDDGENFISQGQNILNISGMYLKEEYRGKGFARLLVNAAVEQAQNLGKPLLGVDYETMNPTARFFWEKYGLVSGT